MLGSEVRIGCAGWSLRSEFAAEFPGEGTHLERYARRFPVVEINSSFYRPHRTETYARWAASTPLDFRFAVKVPREITHTRRLVNTEEPLDRFLSEAGALGEKLGPLLVQLPPSLPFQPAAAAAFFSALRERFIGGVVCEPRHRTWFTPEAEDLLIGCRVARVAADPAPVPAAAEPGGWSGLVYYRLHGSPTIYYSRYSEEYLDLMAATLARSGGWCILDNTAEGEATANALGLQARLAGASAASAGPARGSHPGNSG
ncbi:MAG: hypothetical protein K0Q72_20 [Armatimonadetes bacterium]|jgi:uncharacterized protein YecE (DUF72 family)|nr:hypothetical protein [Armatimonadota bacterium]